MAHVLKTTIVTGRCFFIPCPIKVGMNVKLVFELEMEECVLWGFYSNHTILKGNIVLQINMQKQTARQTKQ